MLIIGHQRDTWQRQQQRTRRRPPLGVSLSIVHTAPSCASCLPVGHRMPVLLVVRGNIEISDVSKHVSSQCPSVVTELAIITCSCANAVWLPASISITTLGTCHASIILPALYRSLQSSTVLCARALVRTGRALERLSAASWRDRRATRAASRQQRQQRSP